MTRETRLKIAKLKLAQGEVNHPYVQEFKEELIPTAEAKEKVKEYRKARGKRRKK